MLIINSIKDGLKKSWHLCLKLFKIIIPIYFIVAVLQYTKALHSIASFFKPLMVIFGLPGEAALALILANGINIYASLTVVETLSLTIKEVTILATMICISHSLPMETTILKGLKMPGYLHVFIRITTAIIIGIIMNLVWK